MGAAYFEYLIKKLLGQDPFNKVKSKPIPKVIEPKKEIKKSVPKIEFDVSPGSMSGVVSAVVGLISIIMVITVYSSVVSSLNMTAMGGASSVIGESFSAVDGMLSLFPLVLIGALMIGMILPLLKMVAD